MGGMVKGVILDESVLLPQSEKGSAAHSLLRKLRHSNLRTGISYALGLSDDKVNLLKRIGVLYSCDCLPLSASSTDIALEEIGQLWGDIGGCILYLVSDHDDIHKISCSQLTILPEVEVASARRKSSRLDIAKLEELPLTICRLNKRAAVDHILTIGYIMKPSREDDFVKRGALPLCPTPNGLMFLPLTFALPLPLQLEEVDVLLHKATDEIVSVELSIFSASSCQINYTIGMQKLKRYMDCQSHCFIIDPFDKINPVVDRLQIQEILVGLEDLKLEACPTIRGPHFLKVNDFNDSAFGQKLIEAKLSLPAIVKPQVACGVTEAHSMGIAFRIEDFKDLNIPLPSIVQEYVDHSSSLFKIYVIGDKVFHAVKNSIPNTDVLMKLYERNGLKPILFDSLKSLPTGSENLQSEDEVPYIDLGLVSSAADWLSIKLGLTIFGFDVVIQEGSGDHVVVDVNYLPSFKEIADDIAVPAFWDAIRRKYESRGMKQRSAAAGGDSSK